MIQRESRMQVETCMCLQGNLRKKTGSGQEEITEVKEYMKYEEQTKDDIFCKKTLQRLNPVLFKVETPCEMRKHDPESDMCLSQECILEASLMCAPWNRI